MRLKMHCNIFCTNKIVGVNFVVNLVEKKFLIKLHCSLKFKLCYLHCSVSSAYKLLFSFNLNYTVQEDLLRK